MWIIKEIKSFIRNLKILRSI